MISSQFRISKSFFPQVIKGAHFSGNFIKIIISNPITNHSKCAAIISKKYYKRATQRNYIKRVIYNIFQKNIPFLPKKTYIIMIIKKIPTKTTNTKTLFNKKTIKQYIELDIQNINNLICKKYE
jgi:ribonuclease P protein component